MVSRRLILFVVAGLLLLLLFVADLVVGNTDIPVADVWGALTGGACPDVTARIIIDIRLMKAVVAVAAGAALSVSGLQMQTLFRNPLAGPYVLGISRVAGCCAVYTGRPVVRPDRQSCINGRGRGRVGGFGGGVAGDSRRGTPHKGYYGDPDSWYDVLVRSRGRGADIAVSEQGRRA